jgi:hypothetical protein
MKDLQEELPLNATYQVKEVAPNELKIHVRLAINPKYGQELSNVVLRINFKQHLGIISTELLAPIGTVSIAPCGSKLLWEIEALEKSGKFKEYNMSGTVCLGPGNVQEKHMRQSGGEGPDDASKQSSGHDLDAKDIDVSIQSMAEKFKKAMEKVSSTKVAEQYSLPTDYLEVFFSMKQCLLSDLSIAVDNITFYPPVQIPIKIKRTSFSKKLLVYNILSSELMPTSFELR